MNSFFSELETQSYDFLKSVIIDAELLKYKPSLLCCSVICASIELRLKLQIGKMKEFSHQLLRHIQKAYSIWESIVIKTYGDLDLVIDFGKYIVLRQQKMYRLYIMQSVDQFLKLHNIYKDRCIRFYEHTLFDTEFDRKKRDYNSQIPYEDSKEAFKFKELEFQHKELLDGIEKIQKKKVEIYESPNVLQENFLSSEQLLKAYNILT